MGNVLWHSLCKTSIALWCWKWKCPAWKETSPTVASHSTAGWDSLYARWHTNSHPIEKATIGYRWNSWHTENSNGYGWPRQQEIPSIARFMEYDPRKNLLSKTHCTHCTHVINSWTSTNSSVMCLSYPCHSCHSLNSSDMSDMGFFLSLH